MRKPFRLLSTAALFCLYLVSPARGQSPPQFQCTKEQDPFFSYCDDINNFLAIVAEHKNSEGKIDRTNRDNQAALRSFLFADSIPDRFTSLLGPVAATQGAVDAIQSAIDAIPDSPNNTSVTSPAK